MNYEKLIAEIVTRVIEKLEALEREKLPARPLPTSLKGSGRPRARRYGLKNG